MQTAAAETQMITKSCFASIYQHWIDISLKLVAALVILMRFSSSDLKDFMKWHQRIDPHLAWRCFSPSMALFTLLMHIVAEAQSRFDHLIIWFWRFDRDLDKNMIYMNLQLIFNASWCDQTIKVTLKLWFKCTQSGLTRHIKSVSNFLGEQQNKTYFSDNRVRQITLKYDSRGVWFSYKH